MLITDTYEEAKEKAKIAQELSDLSGTEILKESRKFRAKMIDESPSPERSKQNNKCNNPPKPFG